MTLGWCLPAVSQFTEAAKQMTPDQIAKGKELAAEWKPPVSHSDPQLDEFLFAESGKRKPAYLST